jgi:thioredoxin-like negative regulator of GroEL
VTEREEADMETDMEADATGETFGALVREGSVLVDVWGPNCAPCLALMPSIEALAARHRGRLRLVKVNAPENRRICRELRVFGLPTYVLFRDGEEVSRLSGDPSLEEIEAAVETMLGGDD